jgi:hypothetical protein
VQGLGQGVLTLVGGRLVANGIGVGITGGISNAHGASDGRITVRDGEIEASGVGIGQQFNNGGPTRGVLELLSSRLVSERMILGPDGELVLGISGPTTSDYGHVNISDVAAMGGDVEVRFLDGFQPTNGDVFDLITAARVTGAYTLEVTGLDPMFQRYMTVTRTSTLLRISFIPEASSFTLTVLASIGMALRRGMQRIA